MIDPENWDAKSFMLATGQAALIDALPALDAISQRPLAVADISRWLGLVFRLTVTATDENIDDGLAERMMAIAGQMLTRIEEAKAGQATAGE